MSGRYGRTTTLKRGSERDELAFDNTTNAMASITYPHKKIHGGNSFKCDTADSDLDDTATIIISFKTPNTAKLFHVVSLADGSLAGKIEVLEGCTISDLTGATLGVFNRDREAATTSGILDTSTVPYTANKATLGATITADGTELHHEYFGLNKKAGGGGSRDTQEWKLARNTCYAFRLTSRAADNVAQLILNWYEHTDIT